MGRDGWKERQWMANQWRWRACKGDEIVVYNNLNRKNCDANIHLFIYNVLLGENLILNKLI